MSFARGFVVLSAVTGLTWLPAIAGYSEGASNAASVAVDATVHYQTMEGFGAKHESLVIDGIGDTLSGAQRRQAIDAIYQQVHLTTGDLDGGNLLESPGSYAQRRNDNDDPFAINWAGFQTFRADALKTKVLDLAQPVGFDDYVLTQRVNVRWDSPWLAGIRSADRDRYLNEAAEQVIAAEKYWRDTYGISTTYELLFNEPLSGNGELAGGTVGEVVDLVKRVGARLRAEGFPNVKFVVPNEETVTKSLQTATAILADPEARQFVGVIGYHPYPYGSTYASVAKILSTSGSGVPNAADIAARQQLRDLGARYGLPVWMTEVSHGDVDPRSFDALRARAVHIHDELEYANAAAYFAILNMWSTQAQQAHFGNQNLFAPQNESTVVFIDSTANTVTISGMGYAIGHYARWIGQGAVRVQAGSSDALLLVSAFRDARQGRTVLVLINNAASERRVNVTLSGVTLGNALNGEQSTSAGAWQPLASFAPLSTTDFAVTVPARSVTTVSGHDAPDSMPTPSGAGRLDVNCDGRVSAADLSAMEELITSGNEQVCLSTTGSHNVYDVTDLEALIVEMFG
jgi:O-glycosyl hydrolase